jgi:two-component system cell cycle response regulator
MAESRDSSIPDLSGGDEDAQDDGDKTKIGEGVKAGPMAGVGLREYPYLVVVAGAGVGEMYRLEGDEAVVGRSDGAQFRIIDDGISRRHARIFRKGGGLSVEDLGSANGTLVNGQPITERALNDGDKISIGSTTILKFTYHDKIDEVFQQKMYEAALRDGLTKTYNKRFMLERLAAELAYYKRHKAELTLVMMDIDHFKAVNDTHGHPGGDAVLVKASAVLQSTLRAEDILARYGGEEFCVLCRNTDVVGGVVIGERMRRRIEETTFEHAGKTFPVTISVGVASASGAGAGSVESLIQAADAALYAAKRAGRNRVCVQPAATPAE